MEKVSFIAIEKVPVAKIMQMLLLLKSTVLAKVQTEFLSSENVFDKVQTVLLSVGTLFVDRR